MVTKSELELLLKTQRDAYNDGLEQIISTFNTRLISLEKELSQAKGEIFNLQQKNNHQDSVIKDLSAKLGQASANEQISTRIDSLEDHSRRNNIRIEGIPEVVNENWEQSTDKVVKLLRDNLKLTQKIEIERAHRVGPTRQDKPRPIIAKLLRFQDKQLILKNSKQLKGTRIFINEDLCDASREKIRNQLPNLKQARSEGKIAYFSHTKLIIRDRPTPASSYAGAVGGSVS